MTNKPLTPLSQRVAVDNYEAKQKAKGLVQFTAWIPPHNRQEFLELAELKRMQYELNGARYDKAAE